MRLATASRVEYFQTIARFFSNQIQHVFERFMHVCERASSSHIIYISRIYTSIYIYISIHVMVCVRARSKMFALCTYLEQVETAQQHHHKAIVGDTTTERNGVSNVTKRTIDRRAVAQGEGEGEVLSAS